MERIYIGIDPGLTGAVACIHASGGVNLFDTPTYPVEKAKKKGQKKAGHRTVYDVQGMADILRCLMAAFWNPEETCPLIVGLEHQQPMPQKMGANAGANQTFSLGYGYGLWVGILGALGLPYELVRPSIWKPAMTKGLPKEKEAARMRANALFPQARGDLMRKKDHNRAEALLMAEWLKRQHGAPTRGDAVLDAEEDAVAGRPF
jgi:crossover junction endodeoxyribonuclease RuvC